MLLPPLRTVTLVALLVGPVCAQWAVPVLANYGEGNTRTQFPFVYDHFRFQMVLSGSSICTTSASITGIAFRRDSQVNTSRSGKVIAQLDVFAAHASNSPATMSSSFQANYASAQTAVFTGTLNLPALPPTPPGQTGPFAIHLPFASPFPYLRASGDLLIDLIAPGQASTRDEYFIDAAYVGPDGFVASIGSPGQFGSGESPILELHPTISAPANLVPGGTVASGILGMVSSYPTVFFFGLSSTFFGSGPLPADLTALGAPGNTLYVRPDALSNVTVPIGTPGDYSASHVLQIPNVASLSGATAYHQAFSLDSSANGLGLVFSTGLAITIGGIASAPEVNMMGSPLSTSSVGGFTMGGSPGTVGGPVTEILGSRQ